MSAMLITGIISAILLFSCTSVSEPLPVDPIKKILPVEGIRIAWDYSTLRQLSRPESNYAGYARMIRLFDGSLVCVYETDGNIECIRSNGDITHWSKPVVVAFREKGIARCVPEILEKSDHSLLISYNLRPEGNNTDTSKRFSIRVKHSNDGGITWNNEKEIYRAGHEFKNGCWEPAQIQLPSGEIQLFIANEGPYSHSDEQEITMFRSFDGGINWTTGETVSFRKGCRDGMPVPLVLKNTNEIIFSIEDNGIAPPEFKPAIIRTTFVDNWSKGAVTGNDKNRSYALDSFNAISSEKYAGAPYIRQLNSGEVILSYQGNEKRQLNKWDLSDMIICIGDSTGRNFNRKSIPFFTSDPTKTSLWNSVTVESDSTVIALASTNIYGSKTGVWMIRGYIQKNIHAPEEKMNIDGLTSEQVYSTTPQVFIGGYGKTNARIWSAYDDQYFYTLTIVHDQGVISSASEPAKEDGIQIFLDPANASYNLPHKGVFAFQITASGKLFSFEGESGSWKKLKSDEIIHSVRTTATGYIAEVAIPWKTLGGKPLSKTRIGFNAVLNEVSNEYSESISGNEKDKPFTWSSLYLLNN